MTDLIDLIAPSQIANTVIGAVLASLVVIPIILTIRDVLKTLTHKQWVRNLSMMAISILMLGVSIGLLSMMHTRAVRTADGIKVTCPHNDCGDEELWTIFDCRYKAMEHAYHRHERLLSQSDALSFFEGCVKNRGLVTEACVETDDGCIIFSGMELREYERSKK